jgi:hypothetical protein
MGVEDLAKAFKPPLVIRYLYSGLLAVGLLQLTSAKKAVDDDLSELGIILAILLVSFAGVLIWTLYHQFLGEIVVFRVVHWIHERVSPNTCDMAFLRNSCGVPRGRERFAYSAIRALYFPAEVGEWVELEHAHNQLLDITWLEILCVLFFFHIDAVHLWGHEFAGWILMSILALLFWAAAVAADIRQHSMERLLMLQKRDDRDLVDWLRKMELATAADTKPKEQTKP